MQNLKNLPSASDSPIKTENSNGHDVRVRHDAPSQPVAAAEPDFTLPKRPRSIKMQVRYLRTLAFAGWLFARVMFWYVYASKILGSDFVMRNHHKRMRKYARDFRHFAIALGGVHIKLGQFVSTRIDILPEEVIEELASLQDEVPSVPYPKIRTVLERELGTLENRFRWLNEVPVAAASLGQVYRGQLKSDGVSHGDRVVVKVQRPGIRDVCYTDLAALKIVAHIAMRVKFLRRRADLPALADEFGRVLLQELSYKQEARNAERFAAIFKDDMGIYIPKVYHEHSTDEVITIEDVTSIKINDFAALDAAGINRKVVAERLMEAYLKQVFDEQFFHADAHPGNLFVYPLPLENGNSHYGAEGRPFYLIFIDFGMTGTLSPKIANGMVSTLAAVLARDPRKLVSAYKELGLLLPDADVGRIEEATEAAFNQVWGMNMSQLKNIDYKDVAELGSEFNDLIYSMPFYLPQDFIYLGRAIGILSGLCTSLDPNFNPWHELQPYAQKLLAQGFGTPTSSANGNSDLTSLGFPLLQSLFGGNAASALTQLGGSIVERTVSAPVRAGVVLEKLERGELHVLAELDSSVKKQLNRLESQSRRTTRAVMFGSLFIASTLFYTNGDAFPAVICYLMSAVAAWTLWQSE